jgi:hypothetical protein
MKKGNGGNIMDEKKDVIPKEMREREATFWEIKNKVNPSGENGESGGGYQI